MIFSLLKTITGMLTQAFILTNLSMQNQTITTLAVLSSKTFHQFKDSRREVMIVTKLLETTKIQSSSSNQLFENKKDFWLTALKSLRLK